MTIRVGNAPDARLLNFIGRNLLAVLPKQRERFDECKNLLEESVTGYIDYAEFAKQFGPIATVLISLP